MKISLKTCVYENDAGVIQRNTNKKNLKTLGFETVYLQGDVQNLFEFLSQYKIDVLVVNTANVDAQRLKFVLNIIYNNFCENILVVSESSVNYGDKFRYFLYDNEENLDLKIGLELLNIKRDIEKIPSKNVEIIHNKVCELLTDFMFSSSHDGFRYYIEAVTRSYLRYPYKFPMLELYKEISLIFNKTTCAVEKSMRVALSCAFNRLKEAPNTPENIKFKPYLTYDMNNNLAISMMVSKLLSDKDLNENAKILR